MKKLNRFQAFQELCKATNKFGLYISFGWCLEDNIDMKEICSAAPYLDFPKDCQLLSEGQAVILCDSLDERNDLFEKTVGDEGSTKFNKYSGKATVYALTCDPNGQLMNENT